MTADGSLGSAELDKRYGTVSVTLPAGPVRQLTVAASVLPAADRTYELFFSPVWKLEDGSMQQVGALCSVQGWGGDAGVGSYRSDLIVIYRVTPILCRWPVPCGLAPCREKTVSMGQLPRD